MCLLLLGTGLACAFPPEYPRDEQHLSADEPRVCFDCHVLGRGPKPHPSHFEDDGSFKVKRRDCHSCHRPAVPQANATDPRELDG